MTRPSPCEEGQGRKILKYVTLTVVKCFYISPLDYGLVHDYSINLYSVLNDTQRCRENGTGLRCPVQNSVKDKGFL